MIHWQEIATGIVVASAVLYVLWRLRGGKNDSASRAQGPDVPVSRLRRKNKSGGACGH